MTQEYIYAYVQYKWPCTLSCMLAPCQAMYIIIHEVCENHALKHNHAKSVIT